MNREILEHHKLHLNDEKKLYEFWSGQVPWNTLSMVHAMNTSQDQCSNINHQSISSFENHFLILRLGGRQGHGLLASQDDQEDIQATWSFLGIQVSWMKWDLQWTHGIQRYNWKSSQE